MTFLSEDHNILKSDHRGRARVPERREALLDEFERSGLSGAKFAALAGVKDPTFALWAQERQKARGRSAGDPPNGESSGAQVRPQPIGLFEALAAIGVGGDTGC